MHIWVCKGMLLLNAAWDFASGAAIWLIFCTKDVLLLEHEYGAAGGGAPQGEEATFVRRLADMHTAMWSRHEDSSNHAACMLMAWWVVTLGCMRLLAAVMWGEWLILAIVSYGIEAAAFLGEGLKATMVPKKACPASLFSVVCLLVCVSCYFR
jgi:hypothetical protein